MGGPSLMIVGNAFPSVDTFFFLSGLLVAYLSFVQLHKKEIQFGCLLRPSVYQASKRIKKTKPQ